ncbi:MAG TPA: 3-oxoacyl-[acyl-carrier-protein] synthase III C-terminal domain-containing protein [Bdellovibrionota bacterium]|nr:3-oxoacyl-[acyl-carrier-protein] synthase III C-terminal domain-containing protein [Bdellovibrionota bacterium]
MKEVFLSHVSYCLGGSSHSVEESGSAGRLISNASDLRAAGFSRHHLSPATETAYDLARGAVEGIRAKLGQIDSIVYATCIPMNGNLQPRPRYDETRDVKYLMDFPASHLQTDFELDGANVLGLNQQACTSVIGSMRLSASLIRSEPETQRVLCVTGDRFPDGAIYEQAYNLISDGGSCFVATSEPGEFRLLATHAITNGALVQASDDETVGSYFNYTARLLNETLAKAGCAMGDIHWVVPQNTNINAWMILSRLLKIDFERVCFKAMPDVGHIISSDNLVNLKRMQQDGMLKSGQKLLLFMAGYGLNWQAAVLEVQ